MASPLYDAAATKRRERRDREAVDPGEDVGTIGPPHKAKKGTHFFPPKVVATAAAGGGKGKPQ